jgi:hypothetical protein
VPFETDIRASEAFAAGSTPKYIGASISLGMKSHREHKLKPCSLYTRFIVFCYCCCCCWPMLHSSVSRLLNHPSSAQTPLRGHCDNAKQTLAQSGMKNANRMEQSVHFIPILLRRQLLSPNLI